MADASSPPAAVPGSPAAADAAARLAPGFVALALALLLGLQPVTTDLMLPALPHLAADLHAGMARVQLTMSALILAFGIAQLVWGPVSDRFGRRPVLLASLVLYTVASAGAALAAGIAAVIAWRVLQGAAMSAAIVCGRAMIRDLFPPQQGGMVMARALSGMGLLAIASPIVAGVLVAASGWRLAVGAMGVAGAALTVFVAVALPETAQHRHPDATRPGPLLRQCAATLRHPGFRAWTLLVCATYGGLFVFLAGSGVVLIRGLGLAPTTAGLLMATGSGCYIAGTLLCRRWIGRHGLAAAVRRGSVFSAAAVVAFALLAASGARSVPAVMAPVWLYLLGHGVHMPCGQAGAVGAFPKAAGLASALAGFCTAAVAFAIGLWLGHALDGSPRALALGMGPAAACAALLAWTLVRRDGDRLHAA